MNLHFLCPKYLWTTEHGCNAVPEQVFNRDDLTLFGTEKMYLSIQYVKQFRNNLIQMYIYKIILDIWNIW